MNTFANDIALRQKDCLIKGMRYFATKIEQDFKAKVHVRKK